MVEQTSWDGVQTGKLRREKGLRGGYTRYSNPLNHNPSNIQVVKHRRKKVGNEVFTVNRVYSKDGRFLYQEIARHNYFGADRGIKKEVSQSVKKDIQSNKIETYQK